MTITPDWVQEKEAVELLNLSANTLRVMRRERRILPGQHWIYATGKVKGPVHYCISAVREMQCQQTIAAVQAENDRRKREDALRRGAIETYDAPNLDQLIAEVQS